MSKSIAISSAHGRHVRGARSFIDEVDESRRVCNKVAEYLRKAGVTVRGPFNDDTSRSVSANLNAIVGWHNKQSRSLDVSIHFNAFQKTSAGRGVECLYVSNGNQQLAKHVAAGIAYNSPLHDRGEKKRTNLRFLNSTSKPAVLVEVCFVDSLFDSNSYKASFDKICKAIADALK